MDTQDIQGSVVRWAKMVSQGHLDIAVIRAIQDLVVRTGQLVRLESLDSAVIQDIQESPVIPVKTETDTGEESL